MSNMLTGGLEFLRDTMLSHAAQECTYARFGVGSVTLDAILGRTEFAAYGDDQAATRYASKDFMFDASELDFGSGVVEPRKGDTITTSINGLPETYQVLDVNGQCFRKDPHGIMVRVYTKKV
ncbi:MAG: hypothetical protein EBR82_24240 [Caulobacteraceae bacterium]|nr:hypothetical protein [Caulobacteraceae bacterium]